MFSQNWHSHQSQTFETIIINISFFFCKFCEKKAHFKGRWFSSVDASGSADMSILWTYFSNLKLVSTVTCSCCKIISDNVKSLCCCCEASRTYRYTTTYFQYVYNITSQHVQISQNDPGKLYLAILDTCMYENILYIFPGFKIIHNYKNILENCFSEK